MTYPSTFDPTPFVVVWVLFLLLGIGFYVWYAFMLSKVFARLGTESWKAWVPIYNEAEIFRLGGVPAWSVVFFFLPVVNLYGLYLKVVAVSRINAHFGQGTGTTVLAILLPPVWATILAGGSHAADPALQERIAPSVAERSGYAFAVSPEQTPVPPPPAPQPAPGSAPSLPPAGGVPFVPVTAPVTPPPAPVPPRLSVPSVAPPAPVAAPVAPPAAPPVAPPAPSAPPVAPPAPAAPPVVATPPVATPPVVTPPAAPPTPPAGVLPPPPGTPATPTPIVPPPGLLITPPPVVPAEKPAPSMPAQPWAPLDRPTAPPPAEAAPASAAPVLDLDAEGDELDRTVVVDRRPVATWSLVIDDGPTLRLSGSRVVLGRRPAGAGDGAQELAVPDATRTLSKVHARLDLADGVWTVTDLNATNGVIVLGADGSENLLDPGASAPVIERFVLGKVGMRLVLAEGDAAR